MSLRRISLLALLTVIAAALVLGGLVLRTAREQGLAMRLVEERFAGALAGLLDDVDVGDHVQLDWRGGVLVGPVRMSAAVDGGALHVDAQSLRVLPRLGALLRGEVELESIELRDVRVVVKGEPRDLVARARRRLGRSGGERGPEHSASSSALRTTPRLVLDRVQLRILGSGAGSPLELALRRIEAEASCAVTCRAFALASLHSGGRVLFDASRDARSAVLARTYLEASAVADLPPAVLRLAGVELRRGAIDAELMIQSSPPFDVVDISTDFTLSHATLTGARLAAQPVEPLTVRLVGDVRWRRSAGIVELEHGRVSLGEAGLVVAGVSGELEPGRSFAMRLRADDVPTEQLELALPSALLPPPGAPRPRGSLVAWMDASGPWDERSAWELDGGFELVPARGGAVTGAEHLRDPFVHQVLGDDGARRDVLVGPRNPAFVPIAALPEHVIRAVTTAEDAGFFAHAGFELEELAEAVRATGDGRRMRGGSTISQQLAKNLFLTSERAAARKVREALITLAIEQTLSKHRLLEIYLNVIEWGPGVYGIGPAARRYFNQDPARLGPKEAAFLASIIPNPVRYYGYYERGELTPRWEERVLNILGKMHEVGIIDEKAHGLARRSPLVFARR